MKLRAFAVATIRCSATTCAEPLTEIEARLTVLGYRVPMTDTELSDVLLTLLTGTTGRTRAYWRRVLGPMTIHPLATHPRCNWSFSASGSVEDVDIVLKAIDVVRAAHPHVGLALCLPDELVATCPADRVGSAMTPVDETRASREG